MSNIPKAAIDAAKDAMREVTPPPGISKSDWLAEHGDFALIAGAVAAAAPHMRRTITTTAELDELGRNAAIMQPGGTVLVNDGQFEDPWASYAEDPFGGPIWTGSAYITLPAIVLHEGDHK